MSSKPVHPYFQALAAADVSKSSKRQYVRNLQTLCRDTKFSLEEIVMSPKKVYMYLLKQYQNAQTRRNFIAAVRSLFKHVPDLECEYATAAKRWGDLQAREGDAVSERILKGEPSDRERHNWVRWSDVVAKERELAATEYGSIEHLLLAMYVLIEPGRQDYNAVALLSREPSDPAKGNYIIMPTSTLVLNVYKTAKVYNQYRRELPSELMNIIHTSLRRQPRQFLFVQEDGTPYLRRNSYTKFSNRTLERIFDKKFTVSMLRHCYISEGIDFNKSTPGEIFTAAKHMHHSVAQQQLYRRFVDSEEEEQPQSKNTYQVVQIARPTPTPPPSRKSTSTFKEQSYIDIPL